jgi:hypothetical protein
MIDKTKKSSISLFTLLSKQLTLLLLIGRGKIASLEQAFQNQNANRRRTRRRQQARRRNANEQMNQEDEEEEDETTIEQVSDGAGEKIETTLLEATTTLHIMQGDYNTNRKTSSPPLSPDDACSICLCQWDQFTDIAIVAVLKCSHSFCASCLHDLHKECMKTQTD